MKMDRIGVMEEEGLRALHSLQQCYFHSAQDRRRAAGDLFLEMFLVYV